MEWSTSVRARIRAAMARRPRIRLRTKVSLLFGFIALVAGVSVAVVTYTFARSSLLEQQTTQARTEAIRKAGRVRNLLPALDDTAFGEYIQTVPGQEGLVQLFREGELFSVFPLPFSDPTIMPVDLRASVAGGEAATQRFRHDGKPYVAVGIPIPSIGVDYFEAYPLDSTERTLRTILLTYAIAAALAVLSFGALGIWTGRRLLRPLGRVTVAAEQIAAGDLDTRVRPQRDPDLGPLVDAFNGMADAVQTRIERESRFVSDVSHELRSPITALQAATDVLERRRDEYDDRSGQAIEVIIDQVRRFDGMVLDLLELSRIDAGVTDMHVELLPIADTSARIAGHYDLADLPVESVADAPSHAYLDRVRFERILGNLLQNAKVHADGPTSISIEPVATVTETDGAGTDPPSADPRRVRIVVEDAGPGVDESEREQIFGRFARGRASRHRVGTGLGLALVSEHASALGGRAWVEPRRGGGSRFVVEMPAGSPAPDEEDPWPDE